MATPRTFTPPHAALQTTGRLFIDAGVLLAVVVIFWALITASHGIFDPWNKVTAPATVSTDPTQLPYYAARSLLRMFLALAAAIVFSLVYATIAARSRRAGMVLLPLLDVLQSVPVLGFLSVTIVFWLSLFPGTAIGLELAAIFAIFTSQAWNMTFAYYQSLITQPQELDEAARLMRLTRWQRFSKVDLPYGMIPLVWNGMMSFGGGWFFLVASEVISANHRVYALPGVGSYVAAASQEAELGHLVLAIAVMIVMVLAVNLLFWRPITAWAERFRTGDTASADLQRSVVLDMLRRSSIPSLVAKATRPLATIMDTITRPLGRSDRPLRVHPTRRRIGDLVLAPLVCAFLGIGLWQMLSYLNTNDGPQQFVLASGLGVITLLRVIVVVTLASIIWVPIGVWIGLSPKVTRYAQPIVQLLASFPANFLFPLVTVLLITSGMSLDLGGIFLMALGAQWYLLFNVIAGAAAIPNDLREVATNLGLGPWQKWRTLYGPAIFASWVTGAITAAGGAWNASIVAEVVSYGDTTLRAHGIGSYIADATSTGNFTKTLIGVTVMSLFVVALNRVVWRPLYGFAKRRTSPN